MQEIKRSDFFHTATTHDFFSHDTKREYLKNKLLHPQNRLIHKPLQIWIPTIRHEMQLIKNNEMKHLLAKEIADLYRDAITIFMGLENYKNASEICYSQIQFFIQLSEMNQNPKLLKYAFNAWISLSRIDRAQGDIENALNKINMLNTNNTNLIPLSEALYADPEINHVVSSLYNVQKIKIYLSAKRYNDLIAFIESKNFYSSTIHRSLFYEALAIAFANTGRIDDALDLFSFIKTDSNTTLIHIFNLRENEIQTLLSDKNIKADLALSQKLALCSLRGEFITPDDIIFGLHTAAVLQNGGLYDEAKKLTHFCLIASHRMNDDLLKAESLTRLHGLMLTKEEQKWIENLMFTYYLDTSYVAARHRMLAIFQDLKHGQTLNLEQESNALFEDLLSLK